MRHLEYDSKRHPEIGIYRSSVREAWRAFFARRYERRDATFADSEHGGREGALRAALRWRRRLEREHGGRSRGWWLGPDRAGGIYESERDGRFYAHLTFMGDTLRASWSINLHGRAGAYKLAEAELAKWRRQVRRIYSSVVRDLRRKAA